MSNNKPVDNEVKIYLKNKDGKRVSEFLKENPDKTFAFCAKLFSEFGQNVKFGTIKGIADLVSKIL